MSGFGGGFGSSQPPIQPTFGNQQTPSQPQFGGGFGSNPQSFGSSPTAPPSFGGGGFNTAASSPFGGNTAAPVPSFGTSSNIAAPSGSSFGQAPSNFGTASGGFGSPPPTTAPSFGGLSQNPTFPAIPVTQSTPQQQFGACQPFGGGTPSPSQPFGGTAPVAQPFGGSSTVSSQSTSFGQGTPGGFGQAAAPIATSVANPFGNASTTNTTISFGVSANVVQSGNTDTNMGGFSNSSATGRFNTGTTSFPSSSQQAPSFGAPTSAPAFGATSDNEDMGDAGDSNANSSAQQASFGHLQQQPPLADQKDSRGGSSMSPLPDRSMSPRIGSFSPPVPVDQTTKRPETEEEKLAQLKAKIQEKKKKLLEQKKRKETAAASLLPPETSSLNPKAEAFTPKEATGRGRKETRTTKLGPSSSTDRATLAERNKGRFADSKVQSQLPQGLKERPADKSDNEDETGNDREELENAVSLVGTCMYMCPDDELLRREQEGDIQLLEIPQPGTIHPDGWTLRETAVKRFRRSAADFKLNVPEWVRPPEVLERVCAYLEEWVMERDRQGPDPRFTQVETPPPLDVYQFIWDRTRMVRKDFILQNYVGTGGNCDACAVRCHERIARWHAMCEHQLSHIPDFVTMQSQQNIQELGQTMKTLNMYYDDALGRSTIESSGVDGKMRVPPGAGCHSDVVMGKAPVDYNGSPLQNKTADPTRLLGANTENLPSRGTAESEMRGLYILLTMDNDGGLEVLKYAGRLFRERPHVYNSPPVQLALSIYKAKKDYNYARFFSLLRSPSTPYLFACIMFKYVQQMRKAAFRIMSKTYGAKRKDTGEALYDLYPLKHLVRLLCFEDQKEAQEVCKHYNITVQKIETSTGKSVPVIRWRHSDFCEAKDPVKGTVVLIKPRKMVRTIEAKLKGATRLAVCRGDVSGAGASLLIASHASAVAAQPQVSQEDLERQQKDEEETRHAAMQAEQEKQKRHREEEARKKAEMELKLKQERERNEAERKRQVQLEKEKAEEARRRELLQKKKREAELARKKAEEDERKQREAEQARIAALAAEEERKRRQQAEAERLAAEKAAARKKAEEEERERQRQLALKLRREEEERLLKLRQEEEARKRQEEEARRRRLLEIQRQREEEERRRQEEIERKIALEWERKINAARKLIFWRRWRRQSARCLEAERSQEALRHIDPTYSVFSSVARSFVDQTFTSTCKESDAVTPKDTREHFYRLKLGVGESLNLADCLRESLEVTTGKRDGLHQDRKIEHSTILCKMAVILPRCSSEEDTKFSQLIHEWVNSQLHYGEVTKSRYGDFDSVELRAVAVNGNVENAYKGSDVVLFIIPPCARSSGCDRSIFFDAPSASCFSESTPRFVLILDDLSVSEFYSSARRFVSELGGDLGSGTGSVSLQGTGCLTNSLNAALKSSCCALLKAFADGYPKHIPSVDLVPLPTLIRICIGDALWSIGYGAQTESGNRILSIARATILTMVTELNSRSIEIQDSNLSMWPAKEFADKPGLLVKDYFGKDKHLPVSWNLSNRQDSVEPAMMEMSALLNGTFRYVIDNMLNRAPLSVRTDCENLMDKKQLRRCLQKALLWRETNKLSRLSVDESHVYLPKGEMRNATNAVLECLQTEDGVDDRSDFSTTRCSPNIVAHRGRDEKEILPTMSDEDFVDETPALQSSHRDSSSSNEEAVRYFGLEADVVPLHRGVAELNTGGSPFLSPFNFGSKKMATFGLDDESFLKGSKRSIDQIDRHSKRRRGSLPVDLSKDQEDSKKFTERLEALLNGDATMDADIGDAKLSHLLSKGVPPVELPK